MQYTYHVLLGLRQVAGFRFPRKSPDCVVFPLVTIGWSDSFCEIHSFGQSYWLAEL